MPLAEKKSTSIMNERKGDLSSIDKLIIKALMDKNNTHNQSDK